MTILKRIAAALVMTLIAGMALAQSQYLVRPGDTLVIEVLEDTSLNRATVVLPDGRISFPFAGTVPVAGQNVGQIQTAIANGISANFANRPNVFVSVQPGQRAAAAAPATINVYFMGEVNAPGAKPLPRGTTLLQGLAQSGGLSKFAATKRIQLRRTDPRSGRQSVIPINYRALSDGAMMNDFPLADGDVILVPERRLFE
ncbi:polysaccharide biosynthesis/export family protein [Yoonia sp.]|uniref:polysaccharide biosynthesis/export family protein n=1 Tax=Yoonia sp. TaxID=2212373 RepID=UPI0019E77494|nr:polysaccharide biosynthesis/export family protein [Yoonia sp.]MBE0414343.1 polysaccharide export protein [Yoonia sp.]